MDTGGTFTDAVGVAPDGSIHRVKVLTTSALRGRIAGRLGPGVYRIEAAWRAPAGLLPGFGFRLLRRDERAAKVQRYDPEASLIGLSRPLEEEPDLGEVFEVMSDEEAPVLAARLLTGALPGEPLPVASLRLATTLGTNALLTRQGARVAFFVTRGFGDLLVIGSQERPDLFALEVKKREPLHAAVVEVPERLAADGTVIEALDPGAVEREAGRLAAEGLRVAAVALLHAWRNPAHEQEVALILRRIGFEHVSCSSDLAPLVKLLPRAETALVDAYLAPAVRGHLDRARAALGSGRLHVMTSAGGLVDASGFRPKDGLLSGPAGGVVGMALAAARSGFSRAIGFDMGGTSTDAARFEGDYEYRFEHEVGGARLLVPVLAVETVAAGGGSICRLDGERLRVGPDSAGASPGPACYGAGGPLTLTDVNLLLGRLDPTRFGIPVSVGAARAAFDALLTELRGQADRPPDENGILEGLLEIANERMADAIREVSVRRGYDPRDHALVAFGGAGGQHALAVAERLGITTVLVPQDAGLLSALGLGHAVVERFAERQILEPLEAVETRLGALLDELSSEAGAAVAAEGCAEGEVEVRRRIAHLRLAGQETSVEVELPGDGPLRDLFRERYEALYGYPPEGLAIEVESLRVVAFARPLAEASPLPVSAASSPAGIKKVRARLGGRFADVPVLDRETLSPGARLDGPALVFERHGATVVEPGWSAEADPAGALVLRRVRAAVGRRRKAPDAVRVELFAQRFGAIAREMGERLRRTAVSTNVKERLDFSCAVLDPEGELVVNAPHIPVHLGALGECVRRVREALPLTAGDVAVTNHPAFGGSHLPDVTVITPVFLEDSRTLLGYVASRAHHAEMGGSRPGSMAPDATSLAEEGVVIPPTYLAREGHPRWKEIRRILEAPPYPCRAVADSLADLRAAAAANHAGEEALRALAARHGVAAVGRAMRDLEALAERRLRDALSVVPDGRYEAVERLDDGSPLAVAIEVRGDGAVVDFSGTAPVHPGNLNATPAIVRSVVLYVLRLLLREPLPLNEGLMHAVTLRIPRGLLNPEFPDDPRRAPAVAGGNVETSQRLVDTLLEALGIAACSQGTMNNVLFGNDRFSYYETVCGGCGAGPGFHGASAVHSHMTNTRITDPEILEARYPVRLLRFSVRPGSGGVGRFRGGDGAVREILFLEPMSLSVLTQHRVERPYGVAGGEPGLPGAQRVVRASGEVVPLGAVDGCEVGPGDRLVLETPGGGGWGVPAG